MEMSLQQRLNDETCNYKEMSCRYWDLVDTLMGGNDTIRSQGKKYLPQFHDESDKGYNNRLSRSYLYAGYQNTIDRHAGRPFTVPVKVLGLEDARLTAIEEDVNLEGQNLTSFSKALFKDAENHGLSFTLVDMPLQGSDGSVAGDIAQNVRPKFIHIPATCLYNWSDEVIDNKRQLTEIIYKDDKKRYRWTRESWQVFRQANEDECKLFADAYNTRYLKNDSYWMLESEGVNELGKIPLVVTYFNRIEWMLAKPSLYEMAEVNLQYYQVKSDYDSIARFSMTGMLFAKGFSEKEADNISIGANKVIEASDPQSELKVIEYTGSSTEIGNTSLAQLKADMETLGLKAEMQSSADSTATGLVINDASVNSDLKVWACVVEDSLERCYQLASEWLGIDLPEDFEVIVYKDFTIAGRAEDIALILQAKEKGSLSATTVIDELKSRGIINSNVDTEEELERIAQEMSSVVFGGGFGG